MRRDAIERLLPSVFQSSARPGTVLSGLLEVMEALHEPDERLFDNIDAVFDPYRAPDAFVPWLTTWVGLDWLLTVEGTRASAGSSEAELAFAPGLGRLRNVIAVASRIAQLRGTASGLLLFLNAATGLDGFSISEPPDRPFHFVITAPPGAERYASLLRRIVDVEKPAAATAELVFTSPPSDPSTEAEGEA